VTPARESNTLVTLASAVSTFPETRASREQTLPLLLYGKLATDPTVRCSLVGGIELFSTFNHERSISLADTAAELSRVSWPYESL
jgi:hypothetical protein